MNSNVKCDHSPHRYENNSNENEIQFPIFFRLPIGRNCQTAESGHAEHPYSLHHCRSPRCYFEVLRVLVYWTVIISLGNAKCPFRRNTAADRPRGQAGSRAKSCAAIVPVASRFSPRYVALNDDAARSSWSDADTVEDLYTYHQP